MIIAQITGGLGNQMFQYATAKALSLHLNAELKLDLQSFKQEILPELEVPRKFELTAFKNFKYTEASQEEINSFHSANAISKKIQKLLPPYKRKIYTEREYTFDKNFFSSNKHVYLKGHRQSEKYFKPFAHEIREIYHLNNDVIKEIKELATEISEQNSISIHVRRGDYLRLPIILNWHGVLEKDYYFNGIEIIRSKTPDAKIFYFSDDTEWVKKELMPVYPGVLVSENISKNHYHDFYLMQSCSHQITANSSFSWWAAWLNPNPEKIVIAPKKWFNNAPYDTSDLIPESWNRI